MKIFSLKTMTRVDIAWSLWSSKTYIFRSSFSSLLSHRNHRTVKWGPRELVRMTEVMLNQNPMSSSEDNESALSRAGQVSFACSPSKVAVWVWNLTVGTCVSSLVTQGHFGKIRSGCLVAINSPPPTTINGWLLRLKAWLLSFESNPPRSLWERIPCEDKALTTQSQRTLGIT